MWRLWHFLFGWNYVCIWGDIGGGVSARYVRKIYIDLSCSPPREYVIFRGIDEYLHNTAWHWFHLTEKKEEG